jgi:hypothetical protein
MGFSRLTLLSSEERVGKVLALVIVLQSDKAKEILREDLPPILMSIGRRELQGLLASGKERMRKMMLLPMMRVRRKMNKLAVVHYATKQMKVLMKVKSEL